MAQIYRVDTVVAFTFNPLPGSDQLYVAATGRTRTSGWSNVALAPRYYVYPPADGIWDFDLVGDPPIGIVLNVLTPVAAADSFGRPPWLKGVRVHAESGSKEADLDRADVATFETMAMAADAVAANVIVRQTLAEYDDSFQPIGTCSPWSVRMKKLHHTLVLVVEGPDAAQIHQCLQSSAVAGLIAAIVAAFVTGGAALQAAIAAFLTALQSCLGNSYSARIDNHSHWVEWCT